MLCERIGNLFRRGCKDAFSAGFAREVIGKRNWQQCIFAYMETFEVDITDKKAKALLKQLEALGIITMRPKKVRSLAAVIADIQARAKKLPPISEEEIAAEVKAVRKQRKHAAARKPQARR